MQRDPKKLREAHIRRMVGKTLILTGGVFLIPYAIFLFSGGYRDLWSMGHFGLAISLGLAFCGILVMRPVYRLENPFLHSLDQKRKG